MATRAQLQHIRRHLYKLKRRWGSPVDIYFESSDVNDLETGKRVVTAQKWSVSRGVPLPRKVTQNSLLSIALKELFTRGAVTETGDRQVLLDRTDLPSDFQLGTENWYFIIDGIRYQVLSHEDYEGFAYIVALKSTTGAPRYAQVEMKVSQRVASAQEGDVRPNNLAVSMPVLDSVGVSQSMALQTDMARTVQSLVTVGSTVKVNKIRAITYIDGIAVGHSIKANRDHPITVTDSIGVTDGSTFIIIGPKTLFSQIVVEAAVMLLPHIRVSQVVTEGLVVTIPRIRLSQSIVEVAVQ